MRIRIGALSFAPGVVATIAAALGLALFVSLGRWQLGRAEEKLARQALLDARLAEAPLALAGMASADSLLYRRITATGRWLAARQFYVDNRIRAGRAGFEVITPLALDSGAAVLVNRGWTARDPATYPRPPAVPVPEGRVEVSGLATRPPARFLELTDEAVAGDVWQNLSIERYAAHARLELLPVVVLADRAAPGLAPVTERPDAGVAKHHEYALTWFALAITTVVLWVALNLRRVR